MMMVRYYVEDDDNHVGDGCASDSSDNACYDDGVCDKLCANCGIDFNVRRFMHVITCHCVLILGLREQNLDYIHVKSQLRTC